MDATMINPFITATKNVLETMAFITCKAGKPFVKKEDIARGDVTGVIGITGAANGTIAITFEEACILQIVSNMFGEKMTKIDHEVADAVGELTNMISGQSRKELEALGKIFDAAIPSVVSGKGHTITHYTDGPKIAIPFTTEGGGFLIEVCLEKILD